MPIFHMPSASTRRVGRSRPPSVRGSTRAPHAVLGVAAAALLLCGPLSADPHAAVAAPHSLARTAAAPTANASPATVTTTTGQVFTIISPPTIAVTGGGDAFAGSQLVAQHGVYSPAPTAVGESEWCEFGLGDYARPETVGCARTVMGQHYIYTPSDGDRGWHLRVREKLTSPVDGSTAYAWSAAVLVSYPLDYGSANCPPIDKSGARQGKADPIPPHTFLGAVPKSWPSEKPLPIRYGLCDNFPSPSVQLVVHPLADVASAMFEKVVASSSITSVGGVFRGTWKWSQTLTWTWKRPTAGKYVVCSVALDSGLNTARACKPLTVR